MDRDQTAKGLPPVTFSTKILNAYIFFCLLQASFTLAKEVCTITSFALTKEVCKIKLKMNCFLSRPILNYFTVNSESAI
jgi:hypothetical protein